MRFAVALLFALLAVCATAPRSVEVAQQQMESALARRFPLETRAGQLFAFKVGAPRLALLPDENRLRLDFTLEANDRVAHNALHGELSLSFSLRWEPADSSIRLANLRVERLDVQGLPQRWQSQLQPIAAIVGERLLEDTVLRTFRPEEIERARGWTPGEIRVTSRGVRIELVPPAR